MSSSRKGSWTMFLGYFNNATISALNSDQSVNAVQDSSTTRFSIFDPRSPKPWGSVVVIGALVGVPVLALMFRTPNPPSANAALPSTVNADQSPRTADQIAKTIIVDPLPSRSVLPEVLVAIRYVEAHSSSDPSAKLAWEDVAGPNGAVNPRKAAVWLHAKLTIMPQPTIARRIETLVGAASLNYRCGRNDEAWGLIQSALDSMSNPDPRYLLLAASIAESRGKYRDAHDRLAKSSGGAGSSTEISLLVDQAVGSLWCKENDPKSSKFQDGINRLSDTYETASNKGLVGFLPEITVNLVNHLLTRAKIKGHEGDFTTANAIMARSKSPIIEGALGQPSRDVASMYMLESRIKRTSAATLAKMSRNGEALTQLKEAEEWADKAVTQVRGLSVESEAHCWAELGHVAEDLANLSSGDLEKKFRESALARYRSGASLFANVGLIEKQAEYLANAGEQLSGLGRISECLEALVTSEGLFNSIGRPTQAAKVKAFRESITPKVTNATGKDSHEPQR